MAEASIEEFMRGFEGITAEEALAILGGAVKHDGIVPACIDGRPTIYSAEDVDGHRGILTGEDWVL